jgi:hypothetical protein
MKDMRRHKRISKTLMSWFKFSNGKHAVMANGWDMVTVRDIGAGGLLFNYDRPVEIGSRISLKIMFPFKDEPIRCRADVVRSQRIGSSEDSSIYRVAAEFKNITSADAGLIDRVADEY